jgi:hypothetical protein
MLRTTKRRYTIHIQRNLPHQRKAAERTGGEPFVGPPSEAKKLYKRYKKAHDKTIIAIACVRDPECADPEDEVLRYSKEALRILQNWINWPKRGIFRPITIGGISPMRGAYFTIHKLRR